MIQNNLYFYILKFDQSTLKYQILSTSPDILSVPKKNISDTDTNIQQMLYELSREYLVVSPELLQYKLSDVDLEDSAVNIYYYSLIPYGIVHQNCYPLIINYNEPYPKNLSKILRLL